MSHGNNSNNNHGNNWSGSGNSHAANGGSQNHNQGGGGHSSMAMGGNVHNIGAGGHAHSASLMAASQHVLANGCASGIYVGLGGLQTISGYRASAYSTIISNGGSQVIQLYGSSEETVIKNGGVQVVCKGGKAKDVEICAGGKQVVKTGGVVYGASIYAGGSLLVESLGIVSGGQIYNDGSQTVQSGAIVKNMYINNGIMVISARGSSYNTDVNNGGEEVVDKKGSTFGSVVRNGATQKVKNGGLAQDTIVKAKGTLIVNSGGIASDTQIRGKGSALIKGNGIAKGLIVESKGILTANAGAKITRATLKKDSILNLKGAVTFGGENKFLGVKGKGNGQAVVKLNNKASLVLKSSNSIKNMTLSAGAGATITTTGVGNSVKSLAVARKTNIVFDLTKIGAKGTNVMLSTQKAEKVKAAFSITVSALQQFGTYELGKNLVVSNTAFSLENGNSSISLKVNGGKVKDNGVRYSLTLQQKRLNLTLNPVAGVIAKAEEEGTNLVGTAKCDIFSGGANVSRISGGGGRDVAVYGEDDWGNNIITKTSGSMTILLSGFAEDDVTLREKGKNLVITRADAPEQTITVKNWNSATHNIVYGGTLQKFSKYLNAARPKNALLQAAQTEVWKKSGLLA